MRRIFVAAFLTIASVISFFSWATARIVNSYNFDINCVQYIKRAADASSVDVAKRELGKAIEYCEENGLTEGIVSIFLKQPKNDVGFWYENMKTAYAELEALPEDSTPLEKTNVLMKIRESLTENGENSSYVDIPEGIEIHPNNALYFWWVILSAIGFLVFGIWWLIEWEFGY